jgi:glycosyltransferase involved in cell wall biosynthesis
MVILSLVSQYKPNVGGNATRVSNIFEKIAELGHKVVICTITGSDHNQFDREYFKITGITILRFRNFKLLLLKLKKIIDTFGADIIYTHHEHELFFSCLTVRNLPIVYECHAISEFSLSIKERIIRYFGFMLARKRLKAVFVLSRNSYKIFVNEYRFNQNIVHYTPNGVNLNEINDKFCFGANGNFEFVYAGTLYDWQGVGIILSSAKRILDIAPDIVIKFLGGGPMLIEVQSFITSNNLDERVKVTGYVNKDCYIENIKNSDVVMIPRPSTIATETATPLKLFDAIKYSKPIIMSDVSGLTEVLSSQEALIYKSDDLDGFIDCCRKIYRNKELAISLTSAARKKVENWPTHSDIAKRILSVLEAVINESNEK